jgi:hypothetical protein
MAIQAINIGSSANDGTGDPIRTAMDKINDNFTELYSVTGAGTGQNVSISGNSLISENSNGNIILDPAGTGIVVVATGAGIRLTDHTDNSILFVDADGDVTQDAKLSYNATTNTAVIEDINVHGSEITTAASNQAITINPNGSGAINLTGNTAITGTATISSTLAVTGATAFTGATTHAGATTFNAAVTVSGTYALNVGNLIVDSNISLNGNKLFTRLSNSDIDIDPAGTGTINFRVPTQTTVGSAGSASALPGVPTGYLKIKVGETLRVIPFWAQA